jgi:hypothetical protein
MGAQMAIGSAPEIGTGFGLWGDMTPEQQQRWWEHMNTYWQPYLMNGYATLIHDKNNRYYTKPTAQHLMQQILDSQHTAHTLATTLCTTCTETIIECNCKTNPPPSTPPTTNTDHA